MTEPTTEGGLSLLPYLESRAPGLRLTLTEMAAVSGEVSPSAAREPFGPFAALWHAHVTLDGRKALSELFLLIQPDQYGQAVSGPPVTNPAVEAFWQKVAARLETRNENRGTLLLPGQTDDQGRLIALRPLFYCRHRRRYAHPACPQCGGGLTLCRDDQTLRAAGLQAYSESLVRYLWCAACHAEPIFYARELSTPAPDRLRDARYLVEAFSRLLGREELGGELPCVGCPEATACYGPDTLVHQRMAPLCFFPFHMLVLPAPTIESPYLLTLWRNDLQREIETLLVDTVPSPAAAPPQVPLPVHEQAAQAPGDADERIAAILRTILSQWPEKDAAARTEASAAPPPFEAKPPQAPRPDEDGDSVETIILGAAPKPGSPPTPAMPTPSPDAEKTVLIQPPPGPAKQSAAQDLQATVLISPFQAGQARTPADEELEKTVLMGAPEAPPKAAADDDLAQTVLMTPAKPTPGPPRTPPPLPPDPPPPAPDDLAETVIISPDPAKGRRPKP